jgi:hypothetical protein
MKVPVDQTDTYTTVGKTMSDRAAGLVDLLLKDYDRLGGEARDQEVLVESEGFDKKRLNAPLLCPGDNHLQLRFDRSETPRTVNERNRFTGMDPRIGNLTEF